MPLTCPSSTGRTRAGSRLRRARRRWRAPEQEPAWRAAQRALTRSDRVATLEEAKAQFRELGTWKAWANLEEVP